jgi:hypothetical protein
MKNYLPLFSLLFCWNTGLAQVSGKITDQAGEPLPFSTVYVKGTSSGTTGNVNGDYRLELKPGTYDLVFQFVGYRQRTERVVVGTNPLTLNVTLEEQPVELGEVVIRANAEDPAYAIIRQAIARRKYYRDQVKAYAADVYIKGNIKFIDAPEKFMGRELGNLGGTLDSNRQGIVYLSESQSKLYFQEPGRYREEMISSKVSGNDNGFGFNRASDMDFNLYENTSNFSREVVSPIAANALSYYNYKLLGKFKDEEGRTISKIELLPKREADPVYRGTLYIVENLWNIQSAELLLLKNSINQPALDSLYIRQVHVPVQEPDLWRLFSQNITFRAGVFGFKLGGTFTGVYSNYNLSPDFDKNFFGSEVFKVEAGANEKTVEFWDSLRPIPLTEEEAVDYVRKDSLQEIRKSKPYLDSIDRKNNKFTLGDLFFGYTYNKSYQRKYLEINSPATTVQFNPVQGFNADLNLRYRRELDEENLRWWTARGTVNYGFSDRRLRGTLGLTYQLEQKTRTVLLLNGGIDAVQFNPNNPISKTSNTLHALLSKDNFMKIYDKAFGRVNFQRELFNGVFFTGGLEYAQRSPLVNTTNFSWNKKPEEQYQSNNPLRPFDDTPAFAQNEALTFTANVRLRYRQKYTSYPNRKFIEGSQLPDLWLQYRKGIRAFGSDVNYDLLVARLVETYISLGVIGNFGFQLEVGTFLNDRALQFMDFRHFNGNQTRLGNPDAYANSFLLLPYYDYSTNDDYVQAHFQHRFDGWILNKLPLLRKLGWTEVFKAAYLYTPERKSYLELGVGLDNIGFGVLRLLRFDVAWSCDAAGRWRNGVVFGLRVPIEED